MNLNKIYITLFFLLVFSNCNFSDDSHFSDYNITLKGIVMDSLSDENLSDINITATYKQTLTAPTDENTSDNNDTDSNTSLVISRDINNTIEYIVVASTLTNALGEYSFNLAPNKEYLLNFEHEEYITTQYNVTTNANRVQTLDRVYMTPVTAAQMGTASGYIIDANTSLPLANLNLGLRNGQGNKSGNILRFIQTSDTGKYQFTGIDTNVYTLEVTATDYCKKFGTIYVIGGELGDDQNVSLHHIPTTSIKLNTTDITKKIF